MMNKKIICLLGCLLIASIMTMPVLAQTGSLTVWENIADGVLTSTWAEKNTADWKGENASGTWRYNFTYDENSSNWTISNINGHRWFQTYEFMGNDTHMGIGNIFDYVSATQWYGVMYYLDSPAFGDGTSALYIVNYTNGDLRFWNGTEYNTNASFGIDYGNNVEWEYQNGWIRVKSYFNYGNGTSSFLRWKAWDPSVLDSEPVGWYINITNFKGVVHDGTQPVGLCVNTTSAPERSSAYFRRIFFWNLSYDLNGTRPYIGVPQMTLNTFLNYRTIIGNADSFWNNTQTLKTFANTFDLTSFYTSQFYNTPLEANQNDTIYVFTEMLTDFGWSSQFFNPATLPTNYPNNVLCFQIYVPPDGTDDLQDFCQIRFDMNSDGIYDDNDSSYLVNNTGYMKYFRGYDEVTQWTASHPYGNWYFTATDTWTNETNGGRTFFRSAGHHLWTYYINADELAVYSRPINIGEPFNVSIVLWDDNTVVDSVWQDWNETTELFNATQSDGVPKIFYNNTGWWGIIEYEGAVLDFTDPLSAQLDAPTRNIIFNIIPILISLAIIITIVAIALSGNLITKEGLFTILIISIMGIIVIQIIMGL